MKKIIMLSIISMFFITDALSLGAYSIYISWDPSDPACSCPTGSTDSSYVVNVYIRDVANAVSVVNKTKTAAISVTDAYVPVTEIKDYCDILNHEEVPVFYIQVTVSMLCVGSTPIIVCDGYEQEGPYGCDDFENGLITIPEVIMD